MYPCTCQTCGLVHGTLVFELGVLAPHFSTVRERGSITEHHLETQRNTSGDSNQDNERFVKQAKKDDGSWFMEPVEGKVETELNFNPLNPITF